MPTFDDLRSFNDALIRKALQVAVFTAPMTVTDEIAALKDATGLLALPTGYRDVGRLTTDGVQFPRNIETSDVTSLGASSPTRRDVVRDVADVTFTVQESKEQTFSLVERQDLSAATFDANGNVSWDRPDLPVSPYQRVLVFMKDGEGTDAVYAAVWMPRAQVTSVDPGPWNSESAIQHAVTLTAFVDDTVGTAVRTLWAGSTARLTAMGFTAATP